MSGGSAFATVDESLGDAEEDDDDGADEEKVAAEMGYKTNEKGKKAGYKQIKNLKKLFKQIALKILQNEDIITGYESRN